MLIVKSFEVATPLEISTLCKKFYFLCHICDSCMYSLWPLSIMFQPVGAVK